MKKILALMAVLSLTACGTGPSESDMNVAVKKAVEESNKQLAAMGGSLGSAGQGMVDMLKTEAPEVKKIGCKEDGDNAYRCDIEIISKKGKNATSARFVKGSDGWMITQ